MKKLLHNQLFWRIIWAYTIIIYSYFFGMLIITGEDPKIMAMNTSRINPNIRDKIVIPLTTPAALLRVFFI